MTIPSLNIIMVTINIVFEVAYFANSLVFGAWLVALLTEILSIPYVSPKLRIYVGILSYAIHFTLPNEQRIFALVAEFLILAAYVGLIFIYEKALSVYGTWNMMITLFVIAGALSGFLYGGLFYYLFISQDNDQTFNLRIVTMVASICWAVLGYHVYFAPEFWKFIFMIQFICIVLVGQFYQVENTNKNN
jgi:hypothetical protein